MKRKTIYGSIFAAILMVSLAFIQPVTARESGVTEVVDAVEHISGIAYDDNFQLYMEQLVNDPELIAISEAILSAEDNAQLENLLQEFTMVLESNPAYTELMNYFDNVYGEDIAILQAFSQEATTEDMQTVINSVVSPDGTVVGDNDATADLTSSEEDSSSYLSAPEGEETTDIIPFIDPLDPTDPIYVGDMYPVYAPWLGLPNIKDCSYDSTSMDDLIMDTGEQTVYIWGPGEQGDIILGDTAGEETTYPVGEEPLPPAEEDNTPYAFYENGELQFIYFPSLDLTIPFWLFDILINLDDDFILSIILGSIFGVLTEFGWLAIGLLILFSEDIFPNYPFVSGYIKCIMTGGLCIGWTIIMMIALKLAIEIFIQ